jgi:hypothetical protein
MRARNRLLSGFQFDQQPSLLGKIKRVTKPNR